MHCISLYFWHPFFSDHLSSRNDFRLVMIYDMNTIGNDGFEDRHPHEEADTIVSHQVLANVAGDYVREVCIWSPDTDVLLLLLHLDSWTKPGPHTSRNFLTGKGLKQREIDVVERCALLDVKNVRDWSDYTTLRALSGVKGLSGSQGRCGWLPTRN